MPLSFEEWKQDFIEEGGSPFLSDMTYQEKYEGYLFDLANPFVE